MIASVLGLLATSMAMTQEETQAPTYVFSSEAMAFAEEVDLRIRDGALDGCWTNSSQVESRARYLLETANIPVEPLDAENFPTIWHPTLDIYVNANRTATNICHGSIAVSWVGTAVMDVATDGSDYKFVTETTLWNLAWIAYSGTNLDDLILSSVEQAVQDAISTRQSGARAIVARER